MRRVQKAQKRAEQLLLEHNAMQEGANIRALAEKYAKIVERPLDDISGALVPLEAEGWLILVNKSHSAERKRFTIAHELGHLLLHSYRTTHADRAFKFRDWRSSEGSAVEEIEANQFAAELLMPKQLILKAVQNTELEYAPADDKAFDHLVLTLAKRFKVSKQAMTIRLSSLLA